MIAAARPSRGAEVVIVGGGVEGTAAAWSLTQRGVRDVLVLERETVGSGGTGKSSGIVRCHYGVPSLAAMAWQGLRLFEAAADVLGEDIGFRQTGYLVAVGAPNVAALHANLSAQQALGIETTAISREDAAELWPSANLADFAGFGYERRGGYGDAYRTAQAFAAAARRGGATIRQGTAAVSVLRQRGRVTGVRLADGDVVPAGLVVVAAGPWSPGLVAPLVGKQPADTHVWILGGEAPAFVKSEGPLYVGGPIWRIELASPIWPKASTTVANGQRDADKTTSAGTKPKP